MSSFHHTSLHLLKYVLKSISHCRCQVQITQYEENSLVPSARSGIRIERLILVSTADHTLPAITDITWARQATATTGTYQEQIRTEHCYISNLFSCRNTLTLYQFGQFQRFPPWFGLFSKTNQERKHYKKNSGRCVSDTPEHNKHYNHVCPFSRLILSWRWSKRHWFHYIPRIAAIHCILHS